MITKTDPTSLDSLLEQGLLWTPTASALGDASEWSAPSSFVATNIPEIDRELGGGLQRNAIHTFSGTPLDTIPSTPILLSSYLAIQCRIQGHDKKAVAWIGPPHEWPTPWFLTQIAEDLSPSSLLFVQVTNSADLLWAIKTALSSRSLSAIVAPGPRLNVRETQSLSVLARSGGCSAFFYRKKSDPSPSGYYSHWIVEARNRENSLEEPFRFPSFLLSLRRTKGKQPSKTQWQIIWNNRRFSVHDSTISPADPVPFPLSSQPIDSTIISRYPETHRSPPGGAIDSHVHRTA